MASQNRAGSSNSKSRAIGSSKAVLATDIRSGSSAGTKPPVHRENRARVASQPSRSNIRTKSRIPEDVPARRPSKQTTTDEKVPLADPAPKAMPSQDAELVADPVLAAAQLYPWISMASQTRVQHNSTQRTMLQAIENQAENIIGDENKFREDKIRLQAEKFLNFTEELNKCQPELSSLCVQFFDLECRVSDTISQATLCANDSTGDCVEYLHRCRMMLDRIENLQQESSTLQTEILLKATSSSHTTLRAIKEAMARVLAARIDNLGIASQLVMVYQENNRSQLRIDSLSNIH